MFPELLYKRIMPDQFASESENICHIRFFVSKASGYARLDGRLGQMSGQAVRTETDPGLQPLFRRNISVAKKQFEDFWLTLVDQSTQEVRCRASKRACELAP